jgi:hypothetical protein
MKGKIVAGLIAALLIVSVALFAGCVEKETPTEVEESTPTTEPTVEMTPEEDVTPEPTVTATPEEELTPEPEQTPLPTTEPVLAPGYTWYHDEEFGYKIAYPENWEKIDVIPAGEGMEGAVSFMDMGTPTNVIGVIITSEYDMEELKAVGTEVVINGRKGYAAIDQPMPPVKTKVVAFAVDSRYYVVSVTTSADSFDEQTEMIDNVINSFVIE